MPQKDNLQTSTAQCSSLIAINNIYDALDEYQGASSDKIEPKQGHDGVVTLRRLAKGPLQHQELVL